MSTKSTSFPHGSSTEQMLSPTEGTDAVTPVIELNCQLPESGSHIRLPLISSGVLSPPSKENMKSVSFENEGLAVERSRKIVRKRIMVNGNVVSWNEEVLPKLQEKSKGRYYGRHARLSQNMQLKQMLTPNVKTNLRSQPFFMGDNTNENANENIRPSYFKDKTLINPTSHSTAFNLSPNESLSTIQGQHIEKTLRLPDINPSFKTLHPSVATSPRLEQMDTFSQNQLLMKRMKFENQLNLIK